MLGAETQQRLNQRVCTGWDLRWPGFVSQDFQLQHHWFPRYHYHGLIMFKKGPQNSHFVLQNCSLLPSASFKQAQSDTVGLQP